MSEYQWRVKKAWIGVMRRIKDERGLFKEDKLLGVIRRSGIVRQCGHFCSVEVRVCKKSYTASGAEDRIFPFHSIKLEEGEKCPELELEYVGWCRDHNTPAFRTKQGEIVELTGAGKDEVNTSAIPRSNWPEKLIKIRKVSPWVETRPGVFEKKS
jgi:hypothetical protein